MNISFRIVSLVDALFLKLLCTTILCITFRTILSFYFSANMKKNVFYFLGVKYTAYKLVWILSPFLCHLARVPQSLPPKQTSFLCLPSQTDRQYLNSVRRRFLPRPWKLREGKKGTGEVGRLQLAVCLGFFFGLSP